MRERLRGDQNAKKRLSINEEAESFLSKVEEDLKKVFEIYCSIGEPMNTEKLKSSKALKMFKDCLLVRSKELMENLTLTEEQIMRYKKIVPINKSHLDLVFT